MVAFRSTKDRSFTKRKATFLAERKNFFRLRNHDDGIFQPVVRHDVMNAVGGQLFDVVTARLATQDDLFRIALNG